MFYICFVSTFFDWPSSAQHFNLIQQKQRLCLLLLRNSKPDENNFFHIITMGLKTDPFSYRPPAWNDSSFQLIIAVENKEQKCANECLNILNVIFTPRSANSWINHYYFPIFPNSVNTSVNDAFDCGCV